MRIELLSKNKDFIPEIAKWYFEEWGHSDYVNSIEEEINKLSIFLNEDKLPLILTAIEGDILVGVTQLKFFEMDIYPELEHWLGGVYVAPDYRRRGIAKLIVEESKNVARKVGVQKLYLQTEYIDGGIYSQLGWKLVDKLIYNNVNVAVMELEL